MGWLFFTVSLIIFGVVLNRINVFLVGYNPPYSTKAYFPSIGEIAMTIAIVSSILFCYRFFVTFFPILPGYVPATDDAACPHARGAGADRQSVLDLGDRGPPSRASWLSSRSYSLVHIEAIQASVRTVEEVQRVKARASVVPRWPRRDHPIPSVPSAYKNFYLLDSPVLEAKSDDYEPVGFSHRIHDELVGGDCGVCHHRYAIGRGRSRGGGHQGASRVDGHQDGRGLLILSWRHGAEPAAELQPLPRATQRDATTPPASV